jgi:dienelactone hydrolase
MKRHSDAIAIQLGACNPSGIALSIVEACREIRAGSAYNGTADITSDPAVRLMVHQLAFICKADDAHIADEYSALIEACEKEVRVS